MIARPSFRNANAEGSYEAQAFQIVGFTDGENDEKEPDANFVWRRGQVASLALVSGFDHFSETPLFRVLSKGVLR